MTAAIDQLSKLQDQLLETIAAFEKPIVETVGRVTERIEGVVPENTTTVPYAEHLPGVDELVEANFSFVEKLIAQQKEFVKALVAASKPVTDKVVPEAAEAKAPKAAKAA